MHIARLVVLGNDLGGLRGDVAVEVLEGGGQGPCGPVPGGLRVLVHIGDGLQIGLAGHGGHGLVRVGHRLLLRVAY